IRRGPALVGQGGELAAAFDLDGDQALVLELGDRGIDRARARLPRAVGALTDRAHELIAVHRLLGQQGQHRSADLTAPGPSATSAAASAPEPAAGAETCARPAVPAVAAPTAAVSGEFLCVVHVRLLEEGSA